MDIYEYRQIKDSLWAVGERMSGEKGSPTGALWIYVVTGSKRAAVIDSGMGITKELRTVCEKITDKPMDCYLTHGHPDHAGGASLFDEVYMAPEDEVDFPWALPAAKRLGDLEHFARGDQKLVSYCREHMIQDAAFSYKPIRDGARIDLGGTVLEVISVPGHTPGSLCFLNRKEGYICTGDACGDHQMFGASSTTVAVYKESLLRLLTLLPEGVEMYGGHNSSAKSAETVRSMIQACQEVLDGKTGGDTPHKPMFKEQIEEYKTRKMLVHQRADGKASLVYNAANIR